MKVREEKLIAEAVSGDDDALRLLLETHHAVLRARIAPQIGRRYQSALSVEDVLQLTYLEVFLRIAQYRLDAGGTFLNWLTAIAENNLRDAIRELERQKRPPRARQVGARIGDDSYVTLLASIPGTQTPPAQKASRKEIREIIEAALAELPPDYATVIRLCDLEGRSGAEAAEAIGKSRGAVYMIRLRARDRLAEILGSSSKFFRDSA